MEGTSTYTVSLDAIINAQKLGVVYLPTDAAEILIDIAEVNRPGLQLFGFFDYFDNNRVQIIGKSELSYLQKLKNQELIASINGFFMRKPKAVVVSWGNEIPPEMLEAAKKYDVPLLSTDLGTSEFMSALIAMLNVELAPRCTHHGVLVDVNGEGVLIMGDSGVGKSETAMELIKRGHRLIADDAVEIRRVSARTLVGSSPKNIRHFMELRGIGIVNIRRIFGMGAVKVTQQVDIVIHMEQWDSQKIYDRMGLEEEVTEILGNKVPLITIPVKPGRNLAIIIEVAAMNHRQKKMGYNAAQELLAKLGMIDDISSNGGGKVPVVNHSDWD